MTNVSRNIPIWFWIVAALLLVWNSLGVANFFLNLTLSEEALEAMPQNEKDFHNSSLMWICFGLSVFGGFLGSAALLLKNKLAHSLFLMSLVGVCLHLILALMMEIQSPMVFTMAVVLIIVGCFAIWLSRHANRWMI